LADSVDPLLTLRPKASGVDFALDHLPSEREMVERAESWRPHRSLAVSYLFASEFEE
jgi:3-methyladenine DNA glycosylase/8-oxoguanine DNA glycosylase